MAPPLTASPHPALIPPLVSLPNLWIPGWMDYGFASLTLSLTTALFAVLADEWYCHYLSPVDGDPQVRSRTRQLRYTGLMEWRVSTLISLLPLMLHLSLLLFVVGLVLSLLPEQQGIAVVIGSISLATLMAYLVTNLLPLIFPECPYKTPLSSVVYAIIMWMHRQYSTVKRAVSPVSLPTSESSTVKTLKAWEIHVAKTYVWSMKLMLFFGYIRDRRPQSSVIS